MKDYAALLAHSHEMANRIYEQEWSRKEWLSESLFNFTTYDPGMGELFASKALEVCAAITDNKTFNYISVPNDYQWYLIMVNMPFFQDRLNWGTSIRGAWWDISQLPRSCVLDCDFWEGDMQVLSLDFTLEEWLCFVKALIAFGGEA